VGRRNGTGPSADRKLRLERIALTHEGPHYVSERLLNFKLKFCILNPKWGPGKGGKEISKTIWRHYIERKDCKGIAGIVDKAFEREENYRGVPGRSLI